MVFQIEQKNTSHGNIILQLPFIDAKCIRHLSLSKKSQYWNIISQHIRRFLCTQLISLLTIEENYLSRIQAPKPIKHESSFKECNCAHFVSTNIAVRFCVVKKCKPICVQMITKLKEVCTYNVTLQYASRNTGWYLPKIDQSHNQIF